jgi:tetratricopeptide (TPR) repeat protein
MVDKTGEGNDERARFAFTMKVYDLIRDDRHKEAIALIEKGRKKFKEMESHEFICFYAAIQQRLGNIETAIRLLRKAVQEKSDHMPHHYRLAVALMDAEHWHEADDVLKDVIAMSLERNFSYYLDDCRFRRILCSKALGRTDELKQMRAELGQKLKEFHQLYGIEDDD